MAPGRPRRSPPAARSRPGGRRAPRAPDRGREPARDGCRDRPRPRPRRRQHRGYGALPGSRHAHRRGVAMGGGRGRRRIAPARSSASSATRPRSRRDPVRARRAALEARPPPAAGQVDQPPCRAHRGNGGGGYRDRADTWTPPTRGRPWGRCGRSASPSSKHASCEVPGGLRVRVEGAGLRGPGERQRALGRRRCRSRSENAGTLLRMLPGWLAGPGCGIVDSRRR